MTMYSGIVLGVFVMLNVEVLDSSIPSAYVSNVKTILNVQGNEPYLLRLKAVRALPTPH